MYASLSVTTPPTVEPVAIADAMQHLRVDQTADSALITSLITAARMLVEQWTARAFVTQTLLWTMSQSVPSGALPLLPMPLLVLPIILSAPQVVNKPLELPRSPVQSVASVTWTDTDGNSYPLVAGTDYIVDTVLQPARVRLTWLTTPRYLENIQISFVAGYGDDGTKTPMPVVQAIKLLIAWLYENRGDDAEKSADPPKAVEYLIAPYRIQFFG